MVYFYSSNQINDMGRERKYVGPQGFWQEGRFSVFVTYIGQTSRGFNGLTGINIPLPPHPVVMCWWCPRDAGCPKRAQRMDEYGETGKMQALSAKGSRELSMETATGFYIGNRNCLGATPAHY